MLKNCNIIRWSTSSMVVVFLILIFGPLLSISRIDYECEDQCERRRPLGVRQPFRFNCEMAYHNEDNKKNCRDNCEFCPREVCDETFNASLWHCPEAQLDHRCKTLCNEHRKGIRENYTLDCNTLDRNARKNCKDNGRDWCPRYVYRESEPNLLYCPEENFGGRCKDECDKARKLGDVGMFSFKCNWKYISNASAERSCQDACSRDCPSWVCDDSVDKNAYTCPTLELDEDCSNYCEKNRPTSNPMDAYKLDCMVVHSGQYDWEQSCKDDCSRRCKSSSGGDAVCDTNNPQYFYCPQKEKEKIPPPTDNGIISYKGKCRDYCEKHRGGGFREFELECNGRFESFDEKQKCVTICRDECPSDVCPWGGDKLTCRGIQKEIEKEEEEKKKNEDEIKEQEEHVREELKRRRQELLDREIAVMIQLNEEGKKRTNITIVLVLLIVILIAAIGGLIFYRCRKNNQTQQVQPQQQLIPGQQPANFPQAQWSQSSSELAQQPSSGLGGPQAVPYNTSAPLPGGQVGLLQGQPQITPPGI